MKSSVNPQNIQNVKDWINDNVSGDNFLDSLTKAYQLSIEDQYNLYKHLVERCSTISKGTFKFISPNDGQAYRLLSATKNNEDVLFEINGKQYLHMLMLKAQFEEFGIGGMTNNERKDIDTPPNADRLFHYHNMARYRNLGYSEKPDKVVMPSIYGAIKNQSQKISKEEVKRNYRETVKDIFDLIHENKNLLDEIQAGGNLIHYYQIENSVTNGLLPLSKNEHLSDNMSLPAQLELYNNKLKDVISETRKELTHLEKHYQGKSNKKQNEKKLNAIQVAIKALNSPGGIYKPDGIIEEIKSNRTRLAACAKELDSNKKDLMENLNRKDLAYKYLAAAVGLITGVGIPVIIGLAIHSYFTKNTFNLFASHGSRTKKISANIKNLDIIPLESNQSVLIAKEEKSDFENLTDNDPGRKGKHYNVLNSDTESEKEEPTSKNKM